MFIYSIFLKDIMSLRNEGLHKSPHTPLFYKLRMIMHSREKEESCLFQGSEFEDFHFLDWLQYYLTHIREKREESLPFPRAIV